MRNDSLTPSITPSLRDDLVRLREQFQRMQKLELSKDAKNRKEISTVFQQIRAFSLGGDPPDLGEGFRNAAASARVKGIRDELSDFCDRLASKWGLASESEKNSIRNAVRGALQIHRDNKLHEVPWNDFAVAMCAVISWIVLFAIGYTVHARPYEDVIKEPTIGQPGGIGEIPLFVGSLVMFIVSSIPTNALMLACLSGTIGTAFRRASGHHVRGYPSSGFQDYSFGLTSAFFVFIVLIGGLLTLSVADILTNETQEKHLKLAGTVSLFGFLVGYDRRLLAWMLKRAAAFFNDAMDNAEHQQAQGQPHRNRSLQAPRKAILLDCTRCNSPP